MVNMMTSRSWSRDQKVSDYLPFFRTTSSNFIHFRYDANS